MKKLALFIFAFMFLANTLVVSAWAKPCMMDSPTQMSQDMDASMSGDMPCHDENTQGQSPHCDGVCLCLHVLMSQTLITHDAETLKAPAIISERFATDHDLILTRGSLPLRRPPKLIS
jgi:hypothetical protein